jgi:hypothetical protein
MYSGQRPLLGGAHGTNDFLPLRITTRDGQRRTDYRECLPLQGLPATDRSGHALRRILLYSVLGSCRGVPLSKRTANAAT